MVNETKIQPGKAKLAAIQADCISQG